MGRPKLYKDGDRFIHSYCQGLWESGPTSLDFLQDSGLYNMFENDEFIDQLHFAENYYEEHKNPNWDNKHNDFYSLDFTAFWFNEYLKRGYTKPGNSLEITKKEYEYFLIFQWIKPTTMALRPQDFKPYELRNELDKQKLEIDNEDSENFSYILNYRYKEIVNYFKKQKQS